MIVLVTAVASSAGCAANHGAVAESFGRLTVEALDAKMSEAKAGTLKLAIFDNNQREHYAQGHIPGAKWVQFDQVGASDLPADKDTTLVFYCANEW